MKVEKGVEPQRVERAWISVACSFWLAVCLTAPPEEF